MNRLNKLKIARHPLSQIAIQWQINKTSTLHRILSAT